MTGKQEFVANAAGERLSVVVRRPAKRTDRCVIVCHGFGANKDANFFPLLCHEASARGIAGIRFDFSGNGASEGVFEASTVSKQIEDLASIVSWARRTWSRVFVVGHSLGGVVAVCYAARHSLSGVVSVCAPSHANRLRLLLGDDVLREIEESGSFTWTDPEWRAEPLTLTLPYIADLERHDTCACVRNLSSPFLAIAGTHDDVVPVAEAGHITAGLRDPALVLDGDHNFSPPDDVLLVRQVLGWVENVK